MSAHCRIGRVRPKPREVGTVAAFPVMDSIGYSTVAHFFERFARNEVASYAFVVVSPNREVGTAFHIAEGASRHALVGGVAVLTHRLGRSIVDDD